eukprot:93208-Ditylum_brightwellii.AAC.1
MKVPLNRAIHNECSTIRNLMGSATEAEIGGMYINCQQGEEIRYVLMEMRHPQPPTIVIINNSTAEGIVNDCIKQCRTHAMDMHFYWIRDRSWQGYYLVKWKPGGDNLADYSTKHFPPSHNKKVCSTYLVKDKLGALLTYI